VSFVKNVLQFNIFLARQFRDDHCLIKAASLSYTTLLSLVPLLAVMFSVLAAFPVFETAVDNIQDYIFRNFVPASSEVVQSYVEEFTQQARRLTGPGIFFLVLVALMLMNSVDEVLNEIWRVRSTRRWLAKFVVYWSILTLGPLLLAVSIVLTSYLVSLPILSEMDGAIENLKAWSLFMMPFISMTIALTLLYVLVPNRRIKFRNGLAGAAIAALLFELAKRSFTLYVANVPTYATIYGALAVIPLFLVWIYVSWVVVLLGTEISYCLTLFKKQDGPNSLAPLVTAYRVIGRLWESQQRGETLSEEQIMKLEPDNSREGLAEVMAILESRKYILMVAEAEWILARDANEINLADLYNAMRQTISDVSGVVSRSTDPRNMALFEVLHDADMDMATRMNIPLKRLYQSAEIMPLTGQEIKAQT